MFAIREFVVLATQWKKRIVLVAPSARPAS